MHDTSQPGPEDVLAITLGAGRTRPQGRRSVIGDEPSVEGFVAALQTLPESVDGWWSAGLFDGDYRSGERWIGAWVHGGDADYFDDDGNHAAPPPAAREAFERVASSLPVNAWHPTPRGIRTAVCFDRFVDDPGLFESAARAIGDQIDEALRSAGIAAQRRTVTDEAGKSKERWCGGFVVDRAALTDRARFLFSPLARVGGVARDADVQTISSTLVDPHQLAASHSIPSEAPREPSAEAAPRDVARGTGIDEAVAAYNRDHARQWPRSGGACPACGHLDCFGTLPEDSNRWSCFADAHEADSNGCGLAGDRNWHGDALDLDAHDAGLSRVDLLRREGYLGSQARSRNESTGGRSWTLNIGDYVVVGWPKEGRPLFVTLELRYQGFRVHRDNLDLNSKRSRAQFSKDAASNLPGLIENAAEDIARDLHDLIAHVESVTPFYQTSAASDGDSTADRLVALAKTAELFHDATDRAFASVLVDSHRETWPVRSTRCRNWLRREFYREYEKVPNSQAVQDALGVIEGRAQIDGPLCDVHVRVAAAEGAIFIDLGMEKWEAVRVDAAGWAVVTNPPVRFVRPPGLLPLPTPVPGGSLAELRPFVNVRDDFEWTLFLAWLVAALRPGRPFPVLVISGEQGAAKSTAARIVRALIDPNRAALRSSPRSEHDLVIAARNGWCLAYDNLSSVQPWLSDALCRIATGSGFGTRRLYTDDEEEIFEACRPITVNGIEDLATRGDLVDRAISLFLVAIDKEARLDEETLWGNFGRVHPRILGALFDALSTALRRLPDVRLDSMPRMADFARLGVAAEPAFGCPEGAFLDAYEGSRESALVDVLETSVFAREFMSFVRKRGEPFEGTASELLEAINAKVADSTQRKRAWPKAPHAMAGLLRRLAPSLRQVGIAIEFFRESGSGARRLLRIWLQNSVAERRSDAGATLGDGGDAPSRPESAGPPTPLCDESTDGEVEEGTL